MARKKRGIIIAHQAAIVDEAKLQHDINGGRREIPGWCSTSCRRLTGQISSDVKGPAEDVPLLLLAQLPDIFMQVAMQPYLMARLYYLGALGPIGFDGMTRNEPCALDTPRFEQMQDAQHGDCAELSTGERCRRGPATVDPNGERIKIKGETNSTSHTNADTALTSPVAGIERKPCPPFFYSDSKVGRAQRGAEQVSNVFVMSWASLAVCNKRARDSDKDIPKEGEKHACVLTFGDIVRDKCGVENVTMQETFSTPHPRTEMSDGLESDSSRAPECCRSSTLVACVEEAGAAYEGLVSKGRLSRHSPREPRSQAQTRDRRRGAKAS